MKRISMAIILGLIMALVAIPAQARSLAPSVPQTGEPVPPSASTMSLDDGEDTEASWKGACANKNIFHPAGAKIVAGACLESNGSQIRGKFRVTCYDNWGNPCTMNVGWDQSPPHYRRVINNQGNNTIGTRQRGAAIGVTTTVAYSNWGCPYPLRTQYQATTRELQIRVFGQLAGPFGWDSLWRTGCGA